jgi:hypothetical protein
MKRMLISFLKDHILILAFFFKVELGRATLVYYLLDRLTVFIADVW